MSGFSPDWLAAREPADGRARHAGLLADLGAAFAGRESVTVVDLGCGTGSNLRAIAPHLPQQQRWRLVDHDAALLAAARDRLAAWADRAERDGDDVRLIVGGRDLQVSFTETDLAAAPEAALDGSPDLVTAAALFDLASRPWIGRLARSVADNRAAFYTALTYNGDDSWAPPHPDDDAIRGAFLEHQGRDKGFGPAAGPAATDLLGEAFGALGYRVKTGASPWRLGAAEQVLLRELAAGVAQAVRETGRMPEDRVSAWLAARSEGASCTVGHSDLLASPPA
jgi:SAM-dependent methyltransferase